jgi:hypothetical protein
VWVGLVPTDENRRPDGDHDGLRARKITGTPRTVSTITWTPGSHRRPHGHSDHADDHDYADDDSHDVHAATDDATTDNATTDNDAGTRNPLVSGTDFVKRSTCFARRRSVTAAASCRPAPTREEHLFARFETVTSR